MDARIIQGIQIENLTVQNCLDYLRIDAEDEDIKEMDMILASAKSFIENYVRHDWQYYVDKYGETPKEFTIACLLLVAHWYENRGVIAGKYVSPKGVPFTITTILDMHRGWL